MQDKKMTFSDDMRAKGFHRSALWMKEQDWENLKTLMDLMGYKYSGSLIAKMVAEKLKELR
jgi:hypothetical protein